MFKLYQISKLLSASNLGERIAIAFSLFTIIGASLYYLWPNTASLPIPTLIITIITTVLFRNFFTTKNAPHLIANQAPENLIVKQFSGNFTASKIVNCLFPILAIILAMIFIATSLSHPILTAVRSPWLVFSPANLIYLFLSAAFLIYTFTKSTSRILFIGLMVWCGSMLILPTFLYPQGYGFDPIIHTATVEHIESNGTISPKPPYYAGAYALELSLSAFTFNLIPLDIIDATLTLLALILLFTPLRSHPLALLFLPFGALIPSTPFSLSLIFLLAYIFTENHKPKEKLLFALAALTIHPLVGLPALTIWIMEQLWLHPLNLRQLSPAQQSLFNHLIKICAFAGSVLILPILFIYLNHVPISFTTIFDYTKFTPDVFLTSHYNGLFDLTYFTIKNSWWIIILLALIVIIKTKLYSKSTKTLEIAKIVSLLITSYLLATIASPNFVIAYEAESYSARLIIIAGLFALPFFAKLVQDFLFDTRSSIKVNFSQELTSASPTISSLQSPTKQFQKIILISSLATLLLYGAFPRHDGYAKSAGFNLTAGDLVAVKTIHNTINMVIPQPKYLVLADQVLSSAALQIFGFNNYYGNQYFYPIPTSGQLYQNYLDFLMIPPVNALNQINILKEICKAYPINAVVFTIHDWWWDSKKVVNNTTLLLQQLQLPLNYANSIPSAQLNYFIFPCSSFQTP